MCIHGQYKYASSFDAYEVQLEEVTESCRRALEHFWRRQRLSLSSASQSAAWSAEGGERRDEVYRTYRDHHSARHLCPLGKDHGEVRDRGHGQDCPSRQRGSCGETSFVSRPACQGKKRAEKQLSGESKETSLQNPLCDGMVGMVLDPVPIRYNRILH
jgi:hypothetical protein